METVSIYTCALILALCSCVVDGFDYTGLMKKYYLLCGPDYFCNKAEDTHKFDISPDYSYSQKNHSDVCPKCECDYACARRGDCCPDLFFKFPELRCVNRTVIKGKDEEARDQQFSELMVTTCPNGSTGALREKCERSDTKFRLQNLPVTAKNNYALTYYNKYCAECNGIVDLHQWSLDINCELLADFNYISTFDEVILLAFKQKCIFQTYVPKSEMIESPPENCDNANVYSQENKTLVTKCNETGLWRKFDPSIKFACESTLRGQYRLFKNVFCYMCNPSLHSSRRKIDQCNVTGQWEDYDSGLEKACSDLPSSRATLPYKNIFCYLCNRQSNNSEQFVDINGNIFENRIYDGNFRFEYNLFISRFNLDHFRFIMTNKIDLEKELGFKIITPFSPHTIKTVNGDSIDLANLIQQSVALDPRQVGVCPFRRPLLPPTFSAHCYCDPQCLFHNYRNCCADLALELSITCRDELELSNIEEFRNSKLGFATINSCFQEETYSIFKQGCSRRKQEDDIYSLLPVDLPGQGYVI